MNKEILKLYNENYNVSPTPIRRFKNPFFIPTENQLLYDLVQKGGLQDDNETSIIKKTNKKTNEKIQKENIENNGEDPSFNPSANFYQNEVYKGVNERKLYKKGDEYYKDLSDDRHMVVYNEKNNNLYIIYRGTDPNSLDDIVSDVNIAFQYEKTLFNEYTAQHPTLGKLTSFFGSLLGGVLAPEIITESELLSDAIELTKTGNQFSDQLTELDFKFHKKNIDFILETFYNKNVNLKLVAHSKGGSHAQLMLDYLKNNLSDKAKYRPKSIKVYTYNSMPYKSKTNEIDRDYYPVRTSTDIANPPSSQRHPHLRIIPTDKKGKKFKDIGFTNPLYSHRAEHFVNRDFRNIPMLINKKSSLRIKTKPKN